MTVSKNRVIRVLITRPSPQAEELAACLAGEGIESTVLPMVKITPLPFASTPLPDLSVYDKVVAVSAPAVHLALKWAPANIGKPLWFTLGPATAAVLAAHNVMVYSPKSEATSEGLLRLPGLQYVQQEKILLLKGEGGRTLLECTLRQRKASVTALSLYTRCSPDYSAEQVRGKVLFPPINAIVVTSVEVLDNLVSYMSLAGLTSVMHAFVLVPSGRVARSARQRGFTKVINCEGASHRVMTEALLSLADRLRHDL